jgi:hypothetical protein
MLFQLPLCRINLMLQPFGAHAMNATTKLTLVLSGALLLAACQTNAGRGAAMGVATGGSVVGGAAVGAAGGAAMGGPATTAVGGGARGAAAASLTGGNVATGAIIGGTAGAIRADNANEPAGTCYNVQTNQRVPCPR